MLTIKQVLREEIEKVSKNTNNVKQIDGIWVWNNEWYGRKNCTFYSPIKFNEDKAIVVIHYPNCDNMHYLVKYPSKEEKSALINAMSKNTKPGSLMIQTGGASPGGIQGTLSLLNYGWKIKFLDFDPDNRYWSPGECDKEKMMRWLQKPEMKKYWAMMPGKKTIQDPINDTRPLKATFVKV